jgi:hypothetical protein
MSESSNEQGSVAIRQDFINRRFVSIIGKDEGKYRLALVNGSVGSKEGKIICLQDRSDEAKFPPIGIEPYVFIPGISDQVIPIEDIKWSGKPEPIKLREAGEQGYLDPKEQFFGLKQVLATSLRMNGKNQGEIVLALADLQERYSALPS